MRNYSSELGTVYPVVIHVPACAPAKVLKHLNRNNFKPSKTHSATLCLEIKEKTESQKKGLSLLCFPVIYLVLACRMATPSSASNAGLLLLAPLHLSPYLPVSLLIYPLLPSSPIVARVLDNLAARSCLPSKSS